MKVIISCNADVQSNYQQDFCYVVFFLNTPNQHTSIWAIFSDFVHFKDILIDTDCCYFLLEQFK